MTKWKIWLGVFLGLFIIPELLFGTVFGIVSINPTFVENSDNHALLTFITFIEFLGLLLASVNVYRQNSKSIYKLLSLILFVLSIRAFYIFYLLLATLNFWN